MNTKNKELKLTWEEFTNDEDLLTKYPEINDYLRSVGTSVGGLLALGLSKQNKKKIK